MTTDFKPTRRDRIFDPGQKARCECCSKVITLCPVEGSPFPRYEWRLKDGDPWCRTGRFKGSVFHKPRRT